MFSLLWLVLVAPFAAAWPSFQKRAVIAHDAVVGFPETVPAGITGELYLKYKPYLKIYNGCVPFPAVDAEGNTGGGLAPNGDPSGDCSSSPGQVYSRSASYNGMYALMYAWYMPKDEPSDGLGHRHDWENSVVWISNATESAEILGLAVSAHGNYLKSSSSMLFFSGTRPLVGYESYWPLNHQLIFTVEQGGEQPLIAWESLTDAARTALSDTDFGDATVPFKDATFTAHLADAAL